jgi:putative endonuclease
VSKVRGGKDSDSRAGGAAGRVSGREALHGGGAPRPTAGAAAEDAALAHLRAQGLALVERNFRVARGPGARGGEIDLVMRDRDGTLVFVEVRARRSSRFGGAAASVTPAKQRALVFAAQCYLMRLRAVPACRFDVVAVEGARFDWIRGAFGAG